MEGIDFRAGQLLTGRARTERHALSLPALSLPVHAVPVTSMFHPVFLVPVVRGS